MRINFSRLYKYIFLTEIRLSGANVSTEGRLEIFFDGKWESIIANNWNDNHTRVACRELGFPDGEGELASSLGPGGTERMSWDAEGLCTGNEMSLLDCLSLRNISQDVGKEIGIKCKTGKQLVCKIYSAGFFSSFLVMIISNVGSSVAGHFHYTAREHRNGLRKKLGGTSVRWL